MGNGRGEGPAQGLQARDSENDLKGIIYMPGGQEP